jgi:ubiquinone/menaquinone biosynthesis C-methylase UbiE
MLDLAHQHIVYGRRIRVLARHLAELLPRDASVLDVGSGDGLLARRVLDVRADLQITGVDVLRRDASFIPVALFDGSRLPYADRQFDVVMMVDVLHHALNQDVLLEETVRVAKRAVVIKDHIVQGPLALETLRLMDWVGNARHGVALPYSYWTEDQWRRHFARLQLRAVVMRQKLGLYPWPGSLIFERGLHFIAVLERAPA